MDGTRIGIGPALRRLTGGDRDPGSATVTRQGLWVFLGSITGSGFGFVFWVFAARLFPANDVGVAGSLVNLSALGTSLALLGLDIGFVRFAPRVRRPLRLFGELAAITGVTGAVVSAMLTLFVLAAGGVGTGQGLEFLTLGMILTVSIAWAQLADGAIIGAQKSHIIAGAHLAYGGMKVVAIFLVVGTGTLGLFGAYSVPSLVVVGILLFVLPRLWASENPGCTPHSLREIAPLSLGNWISRFAYSLPSQIGPAVMLLFLDPGSVAYFFIALQLAEVLNYVSQALGKSLFAHGSREDRLTRGLLVPIRQLLMIILLPLVVAGIIGAPFALSVVGGPAYEAHSLALQLFLLATLPKAYYQVYVAQFNVEQRVRALVMSSGVLGASTVGFFLVGLLLHIGMDLLPLAWIGGGVLGLAVAYVAAWSPQSVGAGASPS